MAEKSETAKPKTAEISAAEAAKIEPTLEELRQDVEALKGDFARLMDTLSQTARHGVRGAASEAEMAAGEVSDWAEEQYLALRENIRAQPLTACAIAAGMGLVIGQILMRR